MSVHIEDVLLLSLAQRGKRYVFGSEASPLDPDPGQFDCSELVQWACDRAGVLPPVPDGAYNQWRHTLRSSTQMTVARGINTRGALLFAGSGAGYGRSAIQHVAWSLGNGTTIEARGSRWGVGTWLADRRFNFAGQLPGVDYTPRHAVEEEDVTKLTEFASATALVAYWYDHIAQHPADDEGTTFWRGKLLFGQDPGVVEHEFGGAVYAAAAKK